MPLYIANYRNKTSHLTAAEHGAYLLLIMHYWVTGGLPRDDAQVMRISSMTPAEWKKSRGTLQAFFHDGWKHQRCDEELAKAEQISSKRRTAAEQMHSKRAANAHANAEQKESISTHTRDVLCSSSPSLESSLRGREGEEEPASGQFDQFWSLYPNKCGKKAAHKKFDIALKTVSFERLMTALRAYVGKTDDRPWCNPETWLNQGRWDDEPAIQQRGGVLGAIDRLEQNIENGADSEADQNPLLRLSA